jgi:hypothetical protein
MSGKRMMFHPNFRQIKSDRYLINLVIDSCNVYNQTYEVKPNKDPAELYIMFFALILTDYNNYNQITHNHHNSMGITIQKI